MQRQAGENRIKDRKGEGRKLIVERKARGIIFFPCVPGDLMVSATTQYTIKQFHVNTR